MPARKCPENILFLDSLGEKYVVDASGFEAGQSVSITGCLDSSCVSVCQGGMGCIDGELVPEPGGRASALAALITLLLLHRLGWAGLRLTRTAASRTPPIACV